MSTIEDMPILSDISFFSEKFFFLTFYFILGELPMLETRVRSLGQEDPLEKEMATHFSILAWEIPWMEEPGGL